MIRFNKDTHTYTDEGVRIPSVTQILHWLYPNKYTGVPKDVLENAADFGNRMHEWIETYAMTGRKKRQDEYMVLSTQQVPALLTGFDVAIDSCEEIVSGIGYAGTYDMRGTVYGVPSVIDIKTTAQYDEEYLEWQLGMYKKALNENGIPIERCYCLWVPRASVAKFLEVKPKTDEQIEWLIYRYGEEHYPE